MRVVSVLIAVALAMLAPAAGATPKHASTISGAVTRAADGSAVAGANVFVLGPGGNFVALAFTGPDGSYVVDPGPGTFLVAAFAEQLVAELWDDVPCTVFACDLELATPIALAHGGAATDIDFALAPRARITGTVAGGTPSVPQPDVVLVAETATGDAAGTGTSLGDGTYELWFDPGSVRVRTRNDAQLVDELHPDIACPFAACDPAGATAFTLASGQTQGGVDFVLAPGASLGGTVTVDGSGAPVPFLTVNVHADDTTLLTSVFADEQGEWRVATGMLPGTYRAATAAGAGALRAEVWDDRPCTGANGDDCDIAAGDPIALAAGQTRTDIDFALQRATAVLSGRVTRFGTGAPLVGVGLQLLRDELPVADAQSGFDGSWSVEVAPGTYTLRALPPAGLAEELYPGVQCIGGFFLCAGTAQPLVVVAGQDLVHLDFALAPVATLRATARNADTGAELSAEWFGAVPGLATPLQRFSLPDAPAEFFVLNGGDVRIAGRAGGCGPLGDQACLGERWPDDPCPALRCDLATGAAIAVPKGGIVDGIELALAPGATIAGTLTKATDATPVADAVVDIVDVNRVPITNAATNPDGTYAIGGLGSGPYYVFANPPAPLLGELYDDVTCPNATCALASGTPVATTIGATTPGIDFALAAGGTIAGRVGDTFGGALAGAAVVVFDAAGTQVGAATSDGNGDYTTGGLLPGSYFVRFTRPGYGGVLYDAIACPDGSCDPLDGTPVPVVASQPTSGIDAILAPTGDPGPPQLVFLNRCAGGCSVRGGAENAIANTSSIVTGIRTLGEYPFGDASFAALTQCVVATFARYQVTITTTDPGNVSHREHMVGGSPQELGFSAGVAGVSPYTCGSIPNSISFTFAAAIGDDIHELCWTAAQEIAHGFGLDHEFHPPDAMSYIPAATKGFTPETVPCGEYSARPCVCGAPTQNSNAFLAQAIGLNPQLFGDGFEGDGAAVVADWKSYRSPLPKPVRETPLTCGVDPVAEMRKHRR